jgi:hypothetical protein
MGEFQSRLAVAGVVSENRRQDLPGSLKVAQAHLDPSQADLKLRIGRVPRQEALENSPRLERMIRPEKGIPKTLQGVGITRGFRQELPVQVFRLFSAAGQAKRPRETELEVRIIGVKFQGLLIGLDRGREVPPPQAGSGGLFEG